MDQLTEEVSHPTAKPENVGKVRKTRKELMAARQAKLATGMVEPPTKQTTPKVDAPTKQTNVIVTGSQIEATQEQVDAWLKQNGMAVVPIEPEQSGITEDAVQAYLAAQGKVMVPATGTIEAPKKPHPLKDAFKSAPQRTIHEATAVPDEDDQGEIVLYADMDWHYMKVMAGDHDGFGGTNERGVQFYRRKGYGKITTAGRDEQSVVMVFPPGHHQKPPQMRETLLDGEIFMAIKYSEFRRRMEEEDAANNRDRVRPEDTHMFASKNGFLAEQVQKITGKDVESLLPEHSDRSHIDRAIENVRANPEYSKRLDEITEAAENLTDD